MITDLFNQAVGEPSDSLGEREARQRHHPDLPSLSPADCPLRHPPSTSLSLHWACTPCDPTTPQGEEGSRKSSTPSHFTDGKLRPREVSRWPQDTAKWGSTRRPQAKPGTLNQVFGSISGRDLGSGRLRGLQLQAGFQASDRASWGHSRLLACTCPDRSLGVWVSTAPWAARVPGRVSHTPKRGFGEARGARCAGSPGKGTGSKVATVA